MIAEDEYDQLFNDDDGNISANIMDEEGDTIKLTFNGDFCVSVNTKEYEFLTLNRHNLNMMIDLLDQSEIHIN
jgi:hypothetical protein